MTCTLPNAGNADKIEIVTGIPKGYKNTKITTYRPCVS
ncbi:unnamed protein product [Amoebophrya sp. A25]|nr:unnamed protein product [Amoebophrya sp. A25]|eukprot:GSA25T00001710001.1